MKRPYLLSKRRGIFYYKLPDDTCYHSTGAASRGAATAKVLRVLAGLEAPPADPLLKAFASGFFLPDSPWIARQLAKGRPFGKAHAGNSQGYLDRYILPAFGKDRLSAITKSAVEGWIVALPLSNSTKNHILYCFRTILGEAVDAGLIPASPLERLEPMGKAFRARDVFSAAELRLLFPGDLLPVWGSRRMGVLMLVLASTGIRSGEARALPWRNVLWTDRALLVDRAVKGGSGGTGEIGPTKTGETRVVLLPSRTLAELEGWSREQIHDEDTLVFVGEEGRPLSAVTVTHALPAAIARMGKTAQAKGLPAPIRVGERNLVVHSFRHGYNTMMKHLVNPEVLRALTGHKSEAMSTRYDHPAIGQRVKELEPAREVVETIFGQTEKTP